MPWIGDVPSDLLAIIVHMGGTGELVALANTSHVMRKCVLNLRPQHTGMAWAIGLNSELARASLRLASSRGIRIRNSQSMDAHTKTLYALSVSPLRKVITNLHVSMNYYDDETASMDSDWIILDRLLARMPQLHTLEIHGFHRAGDRDFHTHAMLVRQWSRMLDVVQRGCPRLTTLVCDVPKLRDCYHEEDASIALERFVTLCHQVHSLDMDAHANEIFHVLLRLTHLSHLKFRDYKEGNNWVCYAKNAIDKQELLARELSLSNSQSAQKLIIYMAMLGQMVHIDTESIMQLLGPIESLGEKGFISSLRTYWPRGLDARLREYEVSLQSLYLLHTCELARIVQLEDHQLHRTSCYNETISLLANCTSAKHLSLFVDCQDSIRFQVCLEHIALLSQFVNTQVTHLSVDVECCKDQPDDFVAIGWKLVQHLCAAAASFPSHRSSLMHLSLRMFYWASRKCYTVSLNRLRPDIHALVPGLVKLTLSQSL
jgi:hypothetical protein